MVNDEEEYNSGSPKPTNLLNYTRYPLDNEIMVPYVIYIERSEGPGLKVKQDSLLWGSHT